MSTSPEPRDGDNSTIEGKVAWQSPKMDFLGRLGDLVQGGPGKTTGENDNDQQGNRLSRGQEDR